MVNTRKRGRHDPPTTISTRTRSSARNPPNSEEHKDPGSDVSCRSSPRLSPPTKRTRGKTTHNLSSSDTSPSPQSKAQRVSWDMPSTYCTRLSSRILQNGHAHMGQRAEEPGGGDHAHMNGHADLPRSCRLRKSRFEHLNQKLLFDQLVNSTAEAVLIEMDNISSIRQNREVERLRMWTDTEVENMDMYSRVKRRKAMRRNPFGIQAHHLNKTEEEEEEEEEGTEESHGEEEEEEEAEDEDDGDEAEEAGEEADRPYNLRQRKTVQRYEAPPIEPVNRKQSNPSLFDTHRSPARRSHIRVKKHAIHSSDTTSSSDEERFERRKSKSMTRARNRCLPMNLRAEDLASGVLRDRVKVGASLADVDPMNLDSSVKFDSVGGLSKHIQSLKEMVVFPLLYPEVFEKFKIQPPRGCLFYGPPGTGKTLVARALANECSQGDKKVSFFMRKGADCLSKWVGESERQLRLLFDQAYLMRPSIIFFDEIDGLAPVRSSRQDQIHSSIVSTLLALMDGLDSRGEIVVIGATNRLDSIDPALRRPGRFDREFLFNLPDKKARKRILEIHTRGWSPSLAEPFVEELAEKCVGYCGADIKALCTEAALASLRRRYPQIYGSSVKLQLDVSSIVLGPQDFGRALRTIVPASQRALAPPGRALSPALRPLLSSALADVLRALVRVFPHGEQRDGHSTHGGDNQLLEEDVYSDEDNEGGASSIYDVQPGSPNTQGSTATHRPFLHFTTSALLQPTSYRPRLLLCGPPGSGQTTHLAPALLHHLDKLTVHLLDLPTLYSVSTKTPEESCAQVFREARRSVPSVVFMPHLSAWWEAASDTVRSTFHGLLQDVPSFSPILLLATADTDYTHIPAEVRSMFQRSYGEVVSLSPPGEDDRRKFFTDLLLVQAARAPPLSRTTAASRREVLPVAEAPGPRVLSPEEQRRLAEQEENTLRELRLFLRDVTRRLATDKRFSIFSKPVDIEEVSDYLEVIGQPMDLSTIMTKIDTHRYLTAKDFLLDIDLIASNALEYNPDKDPSDKIIRHRACSLKDTAHAMLAAELDPDFHRTCQEIKESRKKRDTETPAPPPPAVPPPSATAVVTRKPAAEENAGTSTPGPVVDKQPCSTLHIRRKARRRSSWGRGIIRKKKPSYKKETEEEAGPSDSCLTQDEESSCDAVGSQPNGHHVPSHPHGPFTEEESSNEPPVAVPPLVPPPILSLVPPPLPSLVPSPDLPLVPPPVLSLVPLPSSVPSPLPSLLPPPDLPLVAPPLLSLVPPPLPSLVPPPDLPMVPPPVLSLVPPPLPSLVAPPVLPPVLPLVPPPDLPLALPSVLPSVPPPALPLVPTLLSVEPQPQQEEARPGESEQQPGSQGDGAAPEARVASRPLLKDEPPALVEVRPRDKDPTAETPAEPPPAPQLHCVNGDESMDSLEDLHTSRMSVEAEEASTEVRGDGTSDRSQKEETAVEDGGTQERPPQDTKTDAEAAEENQDTEGGAKWRKCRKSLSEQTKGSADRTEKEQIPPPPPLVVDHQRLSALLEAVVKKSEGYRVDQLERLFSLLSQHIYQHRRDYDKTQLLEDMERSVQHFQTFL